MNRGGCKIFERQIARFLEGDIEPLAATRLEEHLRNCPSCRNECDTLKAIMADLAAIGDAVTARLPEVDIENAVMQAIKARRSQLDAQATPSRRRALLWYGLAAAAGLLLVVAVWSGLRRPSANPGRVAVTQDVQVEHGSPASPVEDDAAAPLGPTQTRPTIQDVAANRTTPAGNDNRFASTNAPDLKSLSLDDILQARKDAANSGDSGWARLTQWATLSADSARALANSPDSSPEIVVGAAAQLPPVEAEEVLLTAVGNLPTKPYLRLALARASEGAGDAQQAATQVRSLQDLDPQNALAYYLDARAQMARGDLEGALRALETAQSLDSAHSYALEAARCKKDVLASAGLDPTAAEVLAAFTAGTSEHDFLCDLGKDLLQYCQYYAEKGDVTTANRFAEAVLQMGKQLDRGASLVQERLAGLDVQRAAIESLTGLITKFTVESTHTIEQLTDEALRLVNSFGSVGDFFSLLKNLLSQNGVDFWMRLGQSILQGGDLNLGDYVSALTAAPS